MRRKRLFALFFVPGALAPRQKLTQITQIVANRHRREVLQLLQRVCVMIEGLLAFDGQRGMGLPLHVFFSLPGLADVLLRQFCSGLADIRPTFRAQACLLHVCSAILAEVYPNVQVS